MLKKIMFYSFIVFILETFSATSDEHLNHPVSAYCQWMRGLYANDRWWMINASPAVYWHCSAVAALGINMGCSCRSFVKQTCTEGRVCFPSPNPSLCLFPHFFLLSSPLPSSSPPSRPSFSSYFSSCLLFFFFPIALFLAPKWGSVTSSLRCRLLLWCGSGDVENE